MFSRSFFHIRSKTVILAYMNEITAQATPRTGASNASDFQPPTQNPQAIPGNSVQQQDSLQGVRNPQEFFNDRQNASISITRDPAPAQASVQPTNDATTLAVLAAIAIVVGFILFKISNRMKSDSVRPQAADAPSAEEVSEESVKKPQTAKKAKTAQKTTKTKKKPSAKKAKRQRR